jgi:D-alanine-D-alanine ligase
MNRTTNELIRSYKFWVLVPGLETTDPNLQYYYDFSQSLAEYTRVFDGMQASWQWQLVTMQNKYDVLASIKAQSNGHQPVVFNLCDGDEVNGPPGISVIHELEKLGLPYTGSDAHFYQVTTSKISMKEAFDRAGVSNPPWAIVDGSIDSLNGLFERLGTPLLIKPAVSGGSMGVTVRNVVDNEASLLTRVEELKEGYRGWDLAEGGILAERFIIGPEYTSLIIGSSDAPGDCIIYEPVERVFHASLPETEKFLSFDRLWEIYENESPMPDDENFYTYHPIEPSLAKAIKKLSLDAYCAVGGQGYGRLDIRMDAKSGELFVLEVNAQCGLSEDEDYTSIGAILRITGKSFSEMVLEIIHEALHK